MGGNNTELNIALVGKNNKKYLEDVKAISWKLQHGGNRQSEKRVKKSSKK